MYEGALAGLTPSTTPALSHAPVLSLALGFAQMEAAQPKRDAAARAVHVLTWLASVAPFQAFQPGTVVQPDG